MRYIGLLAFLLTLWAAPTPLAGEDIALLMGTDYTNAPYPGVSKSPLHGINLDIENMKAVAQALGLRTVVLWNETATYQGMKSALASLARTGPNDRVLIYFSGHGTQVPDENGDEADGLDEALVPYDVMAGDGKWKNLLIDDEIGELLDKIPSRHVLVLFDSCHSGTATRAFAAIHSSDAVPKFLDLGYRPTFRKGLPAGDDFLPKGDRHAPFVGIMAAKDTETSLATSVGSLFTNAVAHAFVRDRRSRCSADLETLFQQIRTEVVDAAERIRQKDSTVGSQTPQLEAEDPAMLKQSLQFKGISGCNSGTSPSPAPSPGRTPMTGRMQYWSDFGSHAPETMPFQTNGASMAQHPNPDSPDRCSSRQGLLKVAVVAPRDGYLNILNIGEGDPEATVIFPNQFEPQNHVSRGQGIEIPAPGQTRWCLPARLPAGRSVQNVLVLAVFTDSPVNLYTDGKGTGAFREVPNGARSFAAESGSEKPASGSGSYAAAQGVVTIHR